MNALERELERAAAECAARIVERKRSKRGERLVAVEQSAHAKLEVLRCTRCNAPLWAANAPRNAQNEPCCPEHVEKPASGLTNARALCARCGDSVASGVWAYGGTAFGHDWERKAALCAACGFDATNWLALMRPELPKRLQRTMTPMSVIAWHRKHPPKAVRYVQWCRLVVDGRKAAVEFALTVRAKVDEALALPKYVQFDMSDPEAAWRFLASVGLAQR
ncbi:MAG: hypothetical protein L0Z53_06570 [Acidobacteriales bacterium]|nr:hypothetical protein [Terriglobales bacterium]